MIDVTFKFVVCKDWFILLLERMLLGAFLNVAIVGGSPLPWSSASKLPPPLCISGGPCTPEEADDRG